MIPIVFHPAYEVDIGPHVFPTRKYRLVRDALLAADEIEEADVREPEPATTADVALAHTATYVSKIEQGTLSREEELRLEIPFSHHVRDAMWLCVGGTAMTARLAFDHAVAIHLGGGFHHAYADHGEGFCLINDVAIAARMLRRDRIADRIAIVDLDVHHGNGTAAIFADEPEVFTFSMHQQANYPYDKPPSDLDVGLEDGTGDDTYLDLLDTHLNRLVERHRPEIVFYLAGADPYEGDQLGGLALTREGLSTRDEMVFRVLRDARIPCAVTLAGGYAVQPQDTVDIHCDTVRAASWTTR